ncbi:TRAP transporter large permease [Rhizobium sp. SGZ-381]|uniref:TRAP transporter large permease n=1 Tax=Rhizobium sp. SGZ-381 TaxID=3342800 RepID=UPI00366BFE93
MSILICLLFFAFCILSIPLAFSFGLAGLVGVIMSDLPIEVIATRMMYSINSFPLLAIPFFMFAGELMVRGGIVTLGIEFADTIIGRVRGGLGQVTILSALGLASVSGTAVADAAALGSALLKPLGQSYGTRFGAALIAGASNLGPILPPSTAMIVYASIAGPGISVPALFLGGVLPAVLIAGGMSLYVYFAARMRGFPLRGEAFSMSRVVRQGIKTLPVFFLPIIVIGGIVGGVFTATEGGAIAVILAMLLGFFYTRELKVSDLWPCLLGAGLTTASVTVIIAFASTMTFIFSIDGLPDQLAAGLKAITSSPQMFLILVFLLLVIVGMFMESTAAYVMLVPIFVPIAEAYGIDGVHFALVFILTLIVGMLTPPVGVLLFVMCGLSGLKLGEIAEEVWPYILIQFGVVAAVLFFPDVFLALPRLAGY